MKNNKVSETYLVLWSGGLDSTGLIHKLLSDGHSVDAVYVNMLNNAEKTKREKHSIGELNQVFSKNPRFSFLGDAINVDAIQVGNMDFKQFPMFILALMFSIDHMRHDKVALGYVMGDQIHSWTDDIKRVYYSYEGFFDRSGGELPELVFPLSKWSKEDVINEIGNDLVELVTWCENPEHDNCGKCAPCRRMIETTQAMDLSQEFKNKISGKNRVAVEKEKEKETTNRSEIKEGISPLP
jgi:7-cyano-7-deazaguanine synthase in queuosine biosynthesis